MQQPASGVSFTVGQASELAQIPERTLKRKCAEGGISAELVKGNGGTQYRIPLEALPEPAQIRYWVGQLKAVLMTDRRDFMHTLPIPDALVRKVAQAAAVPRRRDDAAPAPWTHEEFEEKTAWFFTMPKNAQAEAFRRAELLWAFEDMEVPEGEKKSYLAEAWAKERGTSRATLYKWRQSVAHLERHQWAYALVPERRKGNMPGAPKADIDPGLWDFIKSEWLTQSKPALRHVYRRAVALANARDLDLPAEKTIARRLAALPLPLVTLMREGEKALDDMYPPMRRDYSTLAVHEIWNADGHMFDAHVRWADGSVSRPIVIAWQDVRTRMIVGFAIGKSESAHLVRQALTAGLERTRAIPQRAYLDNGRAFASKEISGGQATRYRFKVKPDEMQGVLTMLQVDVTWAKPYNGRAKPIERFWQTLTAMARRSEFVGAYCGNKIDNRPEEHDIKNAVDVALFERLLHEEIEAYHDRAHRGDSMDGRSPRQVYEALMASTVVRQPTASQVRRCTLAAQPIKLNRHGEFFILENRYGSDACAALPRHVRYMAYYDPNDTALAVELWDGEDLVATVPALDSLGFADRNAAQDHARAKNAHKRGMREQTRAMQAMDKARDRTTPRDPQATPGAPLPRARVPQLAHLGAGAGKPKAGGAADELTPEYMEEFRQALARGEALRYGS